MIHIETEDIYTFEGVAEKLTKFIHDREGSNWSDSQGFAYEILEILEEN